MNFISQKKLFLERYLELTEKMESDVYNEQYDNLDAYLTRRAFIISEINQLEARAGFPYPPSKTITELIQRISETEVRVNRLLFEKKGGLLIKIQQMNLAKKANQLYQGTGINEGSYFFDKTLGPK